MNQTAIAILLYVLWTLFLLLPALTIRSVMVLEGKRKANEFKTTGEDISPFTSRLSRAHLNCLENLPLFLGVTGVAIVTGNTAVTDPLVYGLILARVIQSTIHMISISSVAVFIRFHFFLIQVFLLIYWAFQLISILSK
jgi:uncharacterized MAPEG superfamily protein